jgi:hypothetical protein
VQSSCVSSLCTIKLAFLSNGFTLEAPPETLHSMESDTDTDADSEFLDEDITGSDIDDDWVPANQKVSPLQFKMDKALELASLVEGFLKGLDGPKKNVDPIPPGPCTCDDYTCTSCRFLTSLNFRLCRVYNVFICPELCTKANYTLSPDGVIAHIKRSVDNGPNAHKVAFNHYFAKSDNATYDKLKCWLEGFIQGGKMSESYMQFEQTVLSGALQKCVSLFQLIDDNQPNPHKGYAASNNRVRGARQQKQHKYRQVFFLSGVSNKFISLFVISVKFLLAAITTECSYKFSCGNN